MSRLHPLELYLASRKPRVGKLQFAAELGVVPSALSRIFNGKRRRLGLDACLRIVEATKGEVTLEQLLKWEPPAALRRVDGRRKPRRTAPARRASGS